MKKYEVMYILNPSLDQDAIAKEVASINAIFTSNDSKVFNVAYVTYANEAKEKYLNVDSKTIEKYGVVSEEVTKQMALGALKEANADISIVTSGIAGPTGGTEYKPVGMVCFGVGIKDNVYTSTKYFGNIGRNKVRSMATEYIIDSAINLIEKM